MYNAKDVHRTRAFYQKLFGFKRGHEWTEFWSEFDSEPLTLCLNGTSKTIRPARAGMIPLRQLMVVLLPALLAPSRPTNSPCPIETLTALRA